MLTQQCLPPPLISTMKSLLFMHMHSSPLSLTARLRGCCTNHSRYINNGWTCSGQPPWKEISLFLKVHTSVLRRTQSWYMQCYQTRFIRNSYRDCKNLGKYNKLSVFLSLLTYTWHSKVNKCNSLSWCSLNTYQCNSSENYNVKQREKGIYSDKPSRLHLQWQSVKSK